MSASPNATLAGLPGVGQIGVNRARFTFWGPEAKAGPLREGLHEGARLVFHGPVQRSDGRYEDGEVEVRIGSIAQGAVLGGHRFDCRLHVG